MDAIEQNLPYLLRGTLLTIEVSVGAICCGVVGGMLINFLRLSSSVVLHKLAAIYTSVFRGTPILLQLLVVFYVPTAFGLNLPSLFAAILALALNTSAFQSEIYRGGFASIPTGHLEAASALGMSTMSTFIHIQVPQVFRLVLPSLFNEVVLVLKASSLVSVIAVTDLTRRSQEVVTATQQPITIYLTAAVIYAIINLVLTSIGRLGEQRLRGYM